MLTYRSPTNEELRGVAQYDNGIWPVRFGVEGDRAADFTYTDDGPDVEWESATAADSALFVDVTGQSWLAHHLIAADTDVAGGAVVAFPDSAVKVLLREVAVAEAWEAAKRALVHAETAESLVDAAAGAGALHLYHYIADRARDAEAMMSRAYDVAKRASRAAMLECL